MITVDNLEIHSSRLNGFIPILHPVSFKLTPNGIYSVVGKNGSGKTTLIKALTGIADRSFIIKGKVYFNNILIGADPAVLKQLRKKNIKYVFQDSVNSFDPLKKLKYYFTPFVKTEAFNQLMNEFLFSDPHKTIDLYPHQLSGGMAQRLSFILALLYDPDLLILDEPTSGIDYPIINLMLHAIKRYAAGESKTVLLVTHDFLFAERTDGKTALLENGQLSDFTDTNTFFRQHSTLLNIYKELKS